MFQTQEKRTRNRLLLQTALFRNALKAAGEDHPKENFADLHRRKPCWFICWRCLSIAVCGKKRAHFDEDRIAMVVEPEWYDHRIFATAQADLIGSAHMPHLGKTEAEFDETLDKLRLAMAAHGKRTLQAWGIDANLELPAGLAAQPAAGTRIDTRDGDMCSAFERDVAMAQCLIDVGVVALNTWPRWDDLVRERLAIDAGGMAVRNTYQGRVFVRYVEASLDYILLDWRTAARVIETDTIAITESPLPTEHRALGLTLSLEGLADWNASEKALRRRLAPSLKGWCVQNPVEFQRRVVSLLPDPTQSISRATDALRVAAGHVKGQSSRGAHSPTDERLRSRL